MGEEPEWPHRRAAADRPAGDHRDLRLAARRADHRSRPCPRHQGSDRRVHHERVRLRLRAEHPGRRARGQRRGRQAGETFSLNGFTGPRGLDQGYVYAGIIENGQPGRAVGGGISQFATTLYNAAYFAAMKDTEHKEHSYYISRYPEGREATVYQNPDGSSVIDLKFTNDAPTGVVIQTIWTPSDITVKLWGTKRYEVESVNGGRFAYTSPSVTVEPIETCSPTSGASGFSTTDTRIIRDLTTGEVVRREKRTVVYNPQPAVVCEEPEPEPEPEPRPKPRPQPSPPPQPDGPPAEQGDVPPGPPADPPGDADGEG
ncbi:VanW family protein [Prauserella oleivorans]